MSRRFAAAPTALAAVAVLTLAAACDRSVETRVAGRADGSGDADGSAAATESTGPARPEDLVVEVRIAASPNMADRGVRIAPGLPPVQLYARVFDAERNDVPARVVWHSLDPDRVEVDALGRLSALGPLGPAFVTASAGDVIAESMPVYVVPAEQLPPVDGSGEDADGTAPVAGSAPAPAAAGPP